MEWIKCTDELRLAMNAGARAIENTKRYHGTVYVRDVFSGHPQEIAYLRAASVLREVSNAPAVDLSPAEQFLQLTEENRERVRAYVAQLIAAQGVPEAEKEVNSTDEMPMHERLPAQVC